MLKIKKENKTSKKEFSIEYKGLDLLHSPVKDILKKLAEDTFSPDNRNDEEKSLKRGLSASADTPCVSAYAQSAYGTPAPRYVPMAHSEGIMHNLEDRLEKHAKDINAIVDNYWNEYDGCEPATPSQDFIDKIESLISGKRLIIPRLQ